MAQFNPKKLKASDFEDMMYKPNKRVNDDTQATMLIENKELRVYDEFNFYIGKKTSLHTAGITWNLMFSYIAFCYDMNSPFVSHSRDNVMERKRYVLYYIGIIEDLNDPIPRIWQDIFNGKYYFVLRMILKYCVLQRSTEWTYYTLSQERLHKYLLESMDDPQLSKECKNIRLELKEVRNELIQGKDEKLEMALERYIGEVTHPLIPEEVAELKRKGKDPYEGIIFKPGYEIVNPYAKDQVEAKIRINELEAKRKRDAKKAKKKEETSSDEK